MTAAAKGRCCKGPPRRGAAAAAARLAGRRARRAPQPAAHPKNVCAGWSVPTARVFAEGGGGQIPPRQLARARGPHAARGCPRAGGPTCAASPHPTLVGWRGADAGAKKNARAHAKQGGRRPPPGSRAATANAGMSGAHPPVGRFNPTTPSRSPPPLGRPPPPPCWQRWHCLPAPPGRSPSRTRHRSRHRRRHRLCRCRRH